MSASFIVVEGNNGAGKTAVARHLAAGLGAALYHYPDRFTRFRSQVGLDSGLVAPVPRLLYYLAGTADLSEVVRGEVAAGRSAVCDRYLAAPVSLFLAEGGASSRMLERLVGDVLPHLVRPDLTILLHAEHPVARMRLLDRGARERGGILTPVEQRSVGSPEFFAGRAKALRTYAALTGPVTEIETSTLSIEEVCRTARERVAEVAQDPIR